MGTLVFMALYAVVLVGIDGCASCRSCRADEVRPSPQAPSKWRPTPPHDFATPPTDGPEEPDPTPPPPPVTPTVPEPVEPPKPEPTSPGTAKTTTSRETSGGIIVEQHSSGTIVINSPGATPTASPQAPAPAAYPLIPGPLPDDQVFGIAKRIGGALYYGITGKCPGKPAAPAAYVLTQQASYVATPVQVAQAPAPAQVQVQAPRPSIVYLPLPTAPTVQASPQQFWTTAQPEPAKKRCRWFGGK